MARTGKEGKRLTPDDREWFIWFLCSRWGKSYSEIADMPSSEFEGHWRFWKSFRWGMQDDLQAIAVANQIRTVAPKSSIQPWMVKEWTIQPNYTHRIQQVIKKPVSAIRSGFLAIARAIEGLKR